MAKSRDYSQSVLAASDELREVYCEPCQRDGNAAVAYGYCVDCPEYLCAQCVTSHKRHRALANHKILDKDSMPLSSKQGWAVPDVCEEKCSTHADKLIEYFCEKCDTIGCSACMTLDHRQCDEVKLIMDKAKDIQTGENFNKFTNRMKGLEEWIKNIEKRIDSNVAENNEMKSKAFKELANCRRQIDQFFDFLEKTMRSEVVDIEQRNENNLKEASKKIQAVRGVLDKIQNEMETKKGSDCALFITVKNAEREVTQIENKLHQIVEEGRMQRYRLFPSSQIRDVMKNMTEICTIITARFDSKIDTRVKNDKGNPNIWGLTTVHDHFCAVLDNNNKCVKIIDTRTNTVTSSFDICAKFLWQLTSISNEKIAVLLTLPDGKGHIQIFPVSANGKLQSVTKTQDLSKNFFHISSGKRHIFGIDFETVYSVSMDGVIKTIREMKSVAGDLAGIYVSSDNDDIYVTGKDGVACLTTDGKVKAVCQDKELESPQDITMDGAGYVYVCSCGTRSVWQLTSDLKKGQVIIDSLHFYITYLRSENKLFLDSNDTIDVYVLSKTRKKTECLPNVSRTRTISPSVPKSLYSSR